MFKPAFLLLCLPAAGMAALATYNSPGYAAGGATTNIVGGLSASSTTWTRPTAFNQFRTPTLATSSGRQYEAKTFTPATTAAYEITTNSGTLTAKSTFVYSGTFNALNPLQNLVVGASGTGTFATPVLTGGQTYTIVTTNTNSGTFGSYNLTLKQGVTSADVANVPNGSPAGSVFTINVTDPGTITSFSSIKLHGLRAGEAGNLLVTLTHLESGKSVDIIDRITGDFGGTPDLNFGNMLGNFGSSDYTFVDSGGSAYPSATGNVVPGTYNLHPGTSGFESSTLNGSLASFIGDSIAGTWQLKIADLDSDPAGANTVLSAFSFTADVVTIPESNTAALLLFVGLGMLGRHRRK
jgi:hypothetical protein